MPRVDQTGPQGQGPMTGRGFGTCRGGIGLSRGYCCGRGQGRFAGRNYLSSKEEVVDLEDQAKDLEADLKALKERISETRGQ